MTVRRILLWPFSLLYGAAAWTRNFLYDCGMLNSKKFETPVICIGNINTGGTGKTTHVEFCIETLTRHFRVAVLSRGYKRKTSGFLKITEGMTALDCGDEPLQMFTHYPHVSFFVSEDRAGAIEKIIESENPDVIVMDDGLQHRAVSPSLRIMLTAYGDLFLDDYVLPSGNLREHKARSASADIIIVSKVPASASESEKLKVFNRVSNASGKDGKRPVLCSTYDYELPYDLKSVSKKLDFMTFKNAHVITFAGLARPVTFQQHINSLARETTHISFADHHQFTESDIESLRDTYRRTNTSETIIVTTEKDASRLQEPHIKELISDLPVYVLPVKVAFNEKDKQFLQEFLISHVRENKNNSKVHSR